MSYSDVGAGTAKMDWAAEMASIMLWLRGGFCEVLGLLGREWRFGYDRLSFFLHFIFLSFSAKKREGGGGGGYHTIGVADFGKLL